MKRLPRLSGLVSSGAVSAGAIGYLAAFVLFQYSGLFGPAPLGIMRVLHQWPALAGVFVLMLVSSSELVKVFLARRQHIMSGRGPRLWRLVFHAGMLLVGTGICISSMTRFEGRLTLTEGQEVGKAMEGMDAATLYAGAYSRIPAEGYSMSEVSPFMTDEGTLRRRMSAKVTIRDSTTRAGRELRIGSIIPLLENGFFYRIAKAGYSPHYRIFDAKGAIIDDSYIAMQIAPPGREDAFLMERLPHKFYLRYYPDASLVQDKEAVPEGKQGPLFMIRVVRNLDIAAYAYASPDDVVKFDELLVSFGDMRRWAEILIVWDPGLYLMVPGLIMILAAGFVSVIKRIRRGDTKEDAVIQNG